MVQCFCAASSTSDVIMPNVGNTKGRLTSFDWFGISCMTRDNFCLYLLNRLIQTSQRGGQQYSDTSPFSIPCWMSLCWMSSCYVSLCWVSRRQPWRNKTVYNVGNRMSTFPTSSNFRMAMSRVANVPVRPIPAEQWTTMGGPGLSFCWKCYSTGFIRLWQGYKKLACLHLVFFRQATCRLQLLEI